MQKYKVIVFDLGGVLLDVSGVEDILDWLDNKIELADFWYLWLHCPAVKQFESGEITEVEFVNSVLSHFKLPIDYTTFEQSYRYWIKGIFTGRLALLEQLKADYQLACLTNTNLMHWPEIVATGILNPLDKHYVSFEMGCVKPDKEIYQKMLDDLDVPAEQVLFIDDNQVNVDTAKALGIDAYRTVGHQALLDLFQQLKII